MRVFTTGQVAKICRCSVRIVTTWFDFGSLKGYRLPGSLDRRIPENELRLFLIKWGLPTDLLDEETDEKSKNTPSIE